MPTSRLKGRPRPKSLVIKHSVDIAGRKTSLTLENAFWQSLKEIASEHDMTLRELIAASIPSGNAAIYRRPFASSCSTSIGSKFRSARVPIRTKPDRLWHRLILSFGHVA